MVIQVVPASVLVLVPNLPWIGSAFASKLAFKGVL